MIEREVQVPKERPIVAAVIYNRLAQGIPLGIDATLRYDLDNFDEPLTEIRPRDRQPLQHPARHRPAADPDRQPRARLAAGRRRPGRTSTISTTSSSRAPAASTTSPPTTTSSSPPPTSTTPPARPRADRRPTADGGTGPGRSGEPARGRRPAGRAIRCRRRCRRRPSRRSGSATGGATRRSTSPGAVRGRGRASCASAASSEST